MHEQNLPPFRFADEVKTFVIECAPCLLNENMLYHSRLYIDTPKDDPWSSDIYRAYNALTRYIKKWLKVEKQTYAGPGTYKLVKDDMLHLMVLERELDI